MIVELGTEENLVVNNQEHGVYVSLSIVLNNAPWTFDVLKTSMVALEALILWKIFV